MKQLEYRHLLAERKELERMLGEVPAEQVISRHSLSKRLRVVQAAIDGAIVDERDPKELKLTFRGHPVVGTQGIFAEFGAKAVGAFNEFIAVLAASAESPLAGTGPLPNRGQNQLLITATAEGSFGFVLQEHQIGQLRLDEETPMLRGMQQAHALLRGVLGTDDDLADAASDIAPRALDRLRDFLKTMVEARAYCAVELGGQEARFLGVEQVARSLERIRKENLAESERELTGAFLGVLPQSRTFEFKLTEDGQVIRGKVAPSVPDIERLNERLGQQRTIRVAETRVGKGRPRYLIVEVPAD